MLTREEWTRGTGTSPVVKGVVWFTDGSRMKEGTGAGFCGQSSGRRLSISLGKYVTIFQDKIQVYAILACAYEIQLNYRPEKYVSLCSDSKAALKALQATRTTFPLVQQCQKVLNDTSTQHNVGLYWVPRNAGVRGN
jgi:hypothetical protein